MLGPNLQIRLRIELTPMRAGGIGSPQHCRRDGRPGSERRPAGDHGGNCDGNPSGPWDRQLRRLLGRDYALAYWLIAPSVVVLGLIAFPFIRAIMLAFYSQPIGGEGHRAGELQRPPPRSHLVASAFATRSSIRSFSMHGLCADPAPGVEGPHHPARAPVRPLVGPHRGGCLRLALDLQRPQNSMLNYVLYKLHFIERVRAPRTRRSSCGRSSAVWCGGAHPFT